MYYTARRQLFQTATRKISPFSPIYGIFNKNYPDNIEACWAALAMPTHTLATPVYTAPSTLNQTKHQQVVN